MKEPLMNRTWAHTLCTLCYVDPLGRNKFFPYFCPMSMLGTCCIAGRVQSLLEREDEICCEMGSSGWTCCLISLPLSFLGPLGGAVYFCCLSNIWRKDVIRMYGLVEEKTSCCFPEFCWFGCHYPCSFFQMYNTLKILKEEGYPSVDNPGPAIGKVITSEKRTYRVALPLGSVPGTFVNVSLPDGRQVTVQVPPLVYAPNNGTALVEIDIVA